MTPRVRDGADGSPWPPGNKGGPVRDGLAERGQGYIYGGHDSAAPIATAFQALFSAAAARAIRRLQETHQ